MADQGTRRPLWNWILLAIAPGLACDALGVLVVSGGEPLATPAILLQLAAPAFGLFYLIWLGRAYVRAGMGQSEATFVLGYGCVNVLLWGAGCGIALSSLEFH